MALAARIAASSAPPSDAPPGWVGKASRDLAAHPRPRAGACRAAPTRRNPRARARDQRGARRAAERRSTSLSPSDTAPTDQAARCASWSRTCAPARSSTLLILDSNPVYTAPGPLGFAEALKRVPFSLALSSAPNETASAATWGVPMAHAWETLERCPRPTTARRRSCSRRRCRSTAASARTSCWRCSPTPDRRRRSIWSQATWKSRHRVRISTQAWHDALAERRRPEHRQPESRRPAALGCRHASAAGAA